MLDFIIKELTFLRFYILVSIMFIFLNRKINVKHANLIFQIILISIFNEIALIYFKYTNSKIGLNTTIYSFVNCLLWFKIICNIIDSNKKSVFYYVCLIFTLFCIVNVLFIEHWRIFNFNVFIAGSLIYLLLFGANCYKKYNENKLTFFQSNQFLLSFTPVIYFLGFSLIFCFPIKKLFTYIVYDKVILFTIISYFVNIIYYTLINIYIYKERKLNA